MRTLAERRRRTAFLKIAVIAVLATLVFTPKIERPLIGLPFVSEAEAAPVPALWGGFLPTNNTKFSTLKGGR